jgi:hypothetical protein
MCNPAIAAALPYVGLAASAAGGLVSGQQNAAYISAVNQQNQNAYQISRRAREDELARQKQFEQQAAGYWDDTTTDMDVADYEQGQSQDQAAFLTDFQDATASDEGMLVGNMDEMASDQVMQEIAKRTAGETSAARARIEALAKLSSYGSTSANRARSLNQNADQLQTINGLRRGSLGVSNFEQNIPAAVVNPPDSTFADILSGVGALAGAYPGFAGLALPAAGRTAAGLIPGIGAMIR